MSLITWYLKLIILNNILLHDSLTCTKGTCLCHGWWVEVSCWDEAVITWDVSGGLCGSDSQFVMFILHFWCFSWELGSWVVTISTKRFLIFSMEVSTFAWVCLSWVTPDRALRFCNGFFKLLLVYSLIVWFPMVSGSSEWFLSGLLKSWGLPSLLVFILSSSCIGKQLWLVSQFVLHYIASEGL